MWQISFFFFIGPQFFFFSKKSILHCMWRNSGTSLLLCLSRLFAFILYRKFALILPGTHSSSHQKKKRWQSLCILKPRCIIVPYFEWTWWYASIYLICVLCSFDSGLCQKDFVKLKQNLSRQYIFCVLRNSYRMARCHIRSQPDN